MAYIGERLKATRAARGLNQDQLAAKTGISRSDLSAFENDRKSVGPDRLARLARALRVSVVELAPAEEPDQPAKMLDERTTALEEEVVELREVLRLAGLAHDDLVARVEALEQRARRGGRPGAATTRGGPRK